MTRPPAPREPKNTATAGVERTLFIWFVAVNLIYYVVFALKFAPLRRLLNLS
jgi:hypothetical protein